MLSVGGPDGCCHFGAIAAIKDRGVPVAAVVGNSFGSLAWRPVRAGPQEDTGQRFEGLVRAYVARE